MKRYWSRCTPHSAVTLDPALIKTPVHCVEYVLLHELCHLAEHNHSPRFYALLDRHMREWRKAQDELDGPSEMLLRLNIGDRRGAQSSKSKTRTQRAQSVGLRS